MKQCLKCYKTYADDSLNFCLEDGELLVSGVGHEPPAGSYFDDPPETMVMNDPRQTNPTHWPQQPTAYQAPMQQAGNAGFQKFATASRSQTLQVVSLGLGAGSLTVGWCCSLGLLLGPAAIITGFIGLSQTKNQPDRYTGRGFAIAGIICGAVYLVLYIGFILIAALAGAFNN